MSEEIVKATTVNLILTIIEYGEIASKLRLTSVDEERLNDILIQAANDRVLEFWITEIDYCICQYLEVDSENNNSEDRRILSQQLMEGALEKFVKEHVNDSVEVNELLRRFFKNRSEELNLYLDIKKEKSRN